MGMLVNGKWEVGAGRRSDETGRFRRKDSAFRQWVTADGSSGFKAEPGRYHLYVAYSCPWAHRTLIFRRLKDLEGVISVAIARPDDRREGWTFGDYPGAGADPANGFAHLHQAYTATAANYTGAVTVPVLWDRKERVIVNNESSEIIRMLNDAFAAWSPTTEDYYPPALQAEIDRVNALVYGSINNGVYRCGFATTQAAYEEAFDLLFAALDEMEARLGRQRYLIGDRLTEADWRLFCTLIRFDSVYYAHFKCNARTIASYPNLSNYLRELYQWPGIAGTVNFPHIIRGYYSIQGLNSTGIIPKGPIGLEDRLMMPHDRARRRLAVQP